MAMVLDFSTAWNGTATLTVTSMSSIIRSATLYEEDSNIPSLVRSTSTKMSSSPARLMPSSPSSTSSTSSSTSSTTSSTSSITSSTSPSLLELNPSSSDSSCQATMALV